MRGVPARSTPQRDWTRASQSLEATVNWRNIPILLTTRSLVFSAVTVSAVGARVTKVAIDTRAREGANKGHEDSLAGVFTCF